MARMRDPRAPYVMVKCVKGAWNAQMVSCFVWVKAGVPSMVTLRSVECSIIQLGLIVLPLVSGNA